MLVEHFSLKPTGENRNIDEVSELVNSKGRTVGVVPDLIKPVISPELSETGRVEQLPYKRVEHLLSVGHRQNQVVCLKVKAIDQLQQLFLGLKSLGDAFQLLHDRHAVFSIFKKAVVRKKGVEIRILECVDILALVDRETELVPKLRYCVVVALNALQRKHLAQQRVSCHVDIRVFGVEGGAQRCKRIDIFFVPSIVILAVHQASVNGFVTVGIHQPITVPGIPFVELDRRKDTGVLKFLEQSVSLQSESVLFRRRSPQIAIPVLVAVILHLLDDITARFLVVTVLGPLPFLTDPLPKFSLQFKFFVLRVK